MTLPPAASLHDRAESVDSRWQQLNDWLRQHRELWASAPFMEPVPDWTLSQPGLADWVSGLSEAQCRSLDDDPAGLAALAAEYLPSLGRYDELVRVGEWSNPQQADKATLPEVHAVDMPGRKRLQAGAFSAALQPLAHPVMDWCCGKGHLGRTLAARGQPVTGLEWNAELVQDGNRLAERFGDPVSLRCQDVMASDLTLPAEAHGVALHACGDLHRQLIRRGGAASLPRLSLSPCCYHLTDREVYQPLSRRAAEHRACLKLARNDLRLAVQETVTAPERVREQTRRVSQWRLGFDALQRQLRGEDSYLPVPSHPSRLANGTFEDFCRWAAQKKGLSLTATVNFEHWQAEGERRWLQVKQYELVRHLFRRPLELWLVLDYGLYLEEQGYRVRIGEFCDRSLTPRNLLIDAVRD
ncbi:methyltransferase [Marinobacter salinisoli]|uniref:Methyltransferase n=1 Tax=Marinobacter salinisoli TaxID=2769486 RepID=A0ABX7MV05_9GAMM|nr:methyltransferase [Marinobacter salinisoli]QSP95327.1 methyltransferase [Marinobacter salinisoli]